MVFDSKELLVQNNDSVRPYIRRSIQVSTVSLVRIAQEKGSQHLEELIHS